MKRLKAAMASIMGLVLVLSPMVLAATDYYAKTIVYFNVPSVATFSVAFPDDYTAWNTVTGTDKAGATDLTSDWVSFNFSSVPETWVEPDHLGVSANGQSSETTPIFYIDNTGNCNEKFELFWDTSLPSNIQVCANSTCTGTCSSPGTIAVCTEIGVDEASETTFASAIATDEFLNITLYANNTAGAAAGETSETIYIHGSC